MKKTILTVVALAAGMLATQAQIFRLNDSHPKSPGHDNILKASEEDKNEDILIFGYCGDVNNSLGTGTAGQNVDAAIYIPEATAKLYAGNQITKLFIGYGTSSYNRVRVYFTETLGGEEMYAQVATITTQSGWNEIELDTPFEIGNKGFYIGYTTKQSKKTDYPLGVDNEITTNPNANFIGLDGDFQNYGSQFGAVCIKAGIKGDNIPQYDVNIISGEIPTYAGINAPFSVELTVSNDGVKTINELEVSATLGEKTIDNLSVSIDPASIVPGERATLVVGGLVSESLGSDLPLTVTINKINGNYDENPVNNSFSGNVTCLEKVFRQNVVVEEFTGTWCGWCVRGITGMNYMEENYGDDGFIGIAVHNGDPMAISAYQTIVNKYSGGGLPSGVVNRTTSFDPNTETLEYYYKLYSRNPAVSEVSLSALCSPGKPVGGNKSYDFAIDATAEFSLDTPSAKYALSFVVIEDNVGPYTQQNYYSGGGNGPMGGWESQPSKVTIEYNEVARLIQTANGIANSLPSSIEKNTPYSYSTTINASNITDIRNVHLIALLLDTKTGRVMNAAKVKPDLSGVDNITSDENANISITGVVGGILVKGDVDKLNVYGIDGSIVNIAGATDMISVAPGLYVVKAVSAHGQTETRKVYVK